MNHGNHHAQRKIPPSPYETLPKDGSTNAPTPTATVVEKTLSAHTVISVIGTPMRTLLFEEIETLRNAIYAA